ncbi:hypothetical protein [Streptomyces sp. NPDC001068]|uniref:hypothetical protein n=1 Tax=Streptomyces sp. NPDC001068 TaxID=3364544 RepID=UPI00368DAE95
MTALALALTSNVTDAIQRALPDYTSAAQKKIEDSDVARQKLSGLFDDSNKELSRCEDGVDELRSCGQAPPIAGIAKWLNTPRRTAGRPEAGARQGRTERIPVEGTPTLHRLVDEGTARTARLELRFTAGIQAYSFTFG